jgi:sulfate transport system permease protein
MPGFGLSLGVSVTYLTLLVLLPLSTLFIAGLEMSVQDFVTILSSPRILAAIRLSFLASLAAAVFNAVAGLLVAWVLVRYRFPGRKILDALIDLPFALPTAVAGIALTTIYSPRGVVGSLLAEIGVKVAFAPLGVIVALVFVGLPFVVRTVQPVLEQLDKGVEEAAATLGAGRFTTMWRVVIPALTPSLLTGFSLAFARGLGEYGSVVFISGNLPMRTEILPLVIMSRLEQFDYKGATALALVVLLASFVMLLAVNVLQGKLRINRGTA